MTSGVALFRILSRFKSLIGLFAIFMATVLALNVLRTSDAFWSVFSVRFDHAPRYQLQQIFLPDQERDIAVLIIGDSLFQDAMPDRIANGTLRRAVISGMDADDVGTLFEALRQGHTATQTRVCNVIVQASPNFMARAKAQSAGQEIGLISVAQPSDFLNPKQAARVFKVVKAWIKAQTYDRSFRTLPHLRIERTVGQAKFADATLENWTEATQHIDQANSIFLIDDRATEWGLDSDLEVSLRRALANTEAAATRMTWSILAATAYFPSLGCDKQSFLAAHTAALSARGN